MIKKLLVYFICMCFVMELEAQGLPCSKPEYRQFDFWLGEWEAFAPTGQKSGDSKISMRLDSCIIFEEWTSASVQRGLRYAGKSFNTYNSTTKQWQQTWVDNVGGSNEYMQGKFENNQMTFVSTPFKFAKDTMAIRRMTFINISADKLRQHGEISKDDGKAWVTEYDLEYRRKKTDYSVVVDSVFRGMEAAYNKADFKDIALYYATNGKISGRTTRVSGRADIIKYWEDFSRLGGTWKLSNLETEKTGEQIWVKGLSTITDRRNKDHKVDFTLVLIQEKGAWRILQDAYW